jgi:hypothetical protein
MRDHVLLLKVSALPQLLRSHKNFILVHSGKDVANSLKRKRLSNHIDLGPKWVIHRLHSIDITNLWWLIDGLYIDPDSIWEVWILTVVPVEISYPLLIAPSLLPSSNELAHLLEIHEGDIVNMSIALSGEDYCWRQTLVAHTLRIGAMLLLAVLVHLVAEALGHRAVLALLMRQMLVFALLLLLNDVIFETLMLDELIISFLSDTLLHAAILDHLDVFGLFHGFGLLDNSAIAVLGYGLLLDLCRLDHSA